MNNFKTVLEAMIAILPNETSTYGTPLETKELYFPSAHKKALQLYSNLVIGIRGVGKSTWTAALADPTLRKSIEANTPDLETALINIGHSENRNLVPKAYPDKDTIKDLLQKNHNAHDIWKAVVIRWLSQMINEPIPREDWIASVSWVEENPENCAAIMAKANEVLKRGGSNGLILFDALDLLSDNWEEMDIIARELLRLVLELKVYSNIHAKVFLREDQLSRTITDFPDASKLLATKTDLSWDIYDLHGLLWQQLCNAPGEGGDILRDYYQEVVGAPPLNKDEYRSIHDHIKRDEKIQRALFEKLAGPWMGKDKRRGVPYIWSVGHLADGNKRISPRSFLNAIKTAAKDSFNRTGAHPLHYESIKKGVQSASRIRVDEIIEDYPWIGYLRKPLAQLNVPLAFSDIEERWKKEFPEGPGAIPSKKLPPQNLERGWLGIKKELIRLGVFVEMRDERINMPDLFRVAFGIGRKGGVPPAG